MARAIRPLQERIVRSGPGEGEQQGRMSAIGRHSDKDAFAIRDPITEEDMADLPAQRLATRYVSCRVQIRLQDQLPTVGDPVVLEQCLDTSIDGSDRPFHRTTVLRHTFPDVFRGLSKNDPRVRS